MTVENLLQFLVDLLTVGEQFIQIHLAEYAPQGGLGQLAGGIQVILHLDDRLLRFHDPEIDHRRDLDRNVVMGDHILGRHLEGHGLQCHPDQAINSGDDQKQPRSPHTDQPSQTQQYAPLVLRQDPHRTAEEHDDQRQEKQEWKVADKIKHGEPPLFCERRAGNPRPYGNLLTLSRMSSTSSTVTRLPAAIGSSLQASQYSPRTKTFPSGAIPDSATPSSPISPSLPVVGRRR